MSEATSLRDEQAEAVRGRLVRAAIALVEEGQEPTMRAIAKAAGVSERTIYRYFANREELYEALVPELRERASAPMAVSADGLEAYARDLFATFDANARLVRALVQAPWASPWFERSRRANLEALRDVLARAFPGAPRAELRSAAAALRVPISGAGWVYLTDCGYSLRQCVGQARWLIRTVMERLERVSGGGHA